MIFATLLLCAIASTTSAQPEGVAYFSQDGISAEAVISETNGTLMLTFPKPPPPNMTITIHKNPLLPATEEMPCSTLALGDVILNGTKPIVGSLLGTDGILGRSIMISGMINNQAVRACSNIFLRPKSSTGDSCTGWSGRVVKEAAFTESIAGYVTVTSYPSANLSLVRTRLIYTTSNSEAVQIRLIAGDTCDGYDDAVPLGVALNGTARNPIRVFSTTMDLRSPDLSIALTNGDKLTACAYAATVVRRTYTADLGMAGKVTVSQGSRFDNLQVALRLRPTAGSATINNLRQNQAAGSSVCDASNQDGIFMLPNTTVSSISASVNTLDMFPRGDLLAKAGNMSNSTFCDNTLTLFGAYSVARRSVKVGANCANLVQQTSETTHVLKARAVFSTRGQVTGTINLEQVVQAVNGMPVFGDTTISSTGLMTNRTTYRHNWHVHIDPVGPTMDVAACSSMNTGGHYNPFSVDVAAMYMSVCNANRQLRCELGDSTGKTGTIDLNGMGFLRQDQYLPLFGMYSVLGRPFVIHVKERGGPRIACANIELVTIPNVYLGLSGVNETFDVMDFQQAVRMSSPNAAQVIVVHLQNTVDSTSTCTYVSAVLIGANAATVAAGLPVANVGNYTQSRTECADGVVFPIVHSSASRFSVPTAAIMFILAFIIACLV